MKPTESTAAPPKITYEQYMKETYFIGDSRTNRMVMYGYVSNTRAFALNGINHSDARNNRFVNLGDGKRYTMAEAVGIKKPVRMVVSLGINGIGFMSESGFFSTYEDFLNGLRQASPDTALVAVSYTHLNLCCGYAECYLRPSTTGASGAGYAGAGDEG